MAIKKPLVVYNGEVKELQSGDYMDVADIDISYVTTPAPQLDKITINDNTLSVHTINITNYVATNSYTVTSNDTSVATIGRIDGVITVTLAENITSTTKETTISVYAMASGATYSGLTNISVLNHSVIAPDDLLQVVDFSIVEESKTDFAYSETTTGSLIASSDNATYTSDTIEQGVDEGDWTSWEAGLESEVACITPLCYIGAQLAVPYTSSFTTGDNLTIVKEDDSIVSLDNIVVTTKPATTSLLGAGADPGTFNGSPYSIRVSTNGAWFYSISGSLLYYRNVTTPWASSEAISPASITPDLSNVYSISFNNEGTRLYVYSYSTDNIREYALSTPWNVTTLTTVQTVTLPNSEVLGFTSSLSFSFCGRYIYSNVSAAGLITIYQWTLSTAWDITTISYTGMKQFGASNYDSKGCQISPDGKYIIVLVRYSTTSTYIIRYTLSTPYDITTMGTTGVLIFSDPVETTPYSMYIPLDGSYIYYSGAVTDAIIRAAHLNQTDSVWDTKIITVSVTPAPKAVGNKTGSDLTLDTNIDPLAVSLGNVLTPTTTTTTFITNILKTVKTYLKVTENFRALGFKLDSLKNNKITKLSVAMTKES